MQKRASLTLKSSKSGRVTRVLRRKGEVVKAADPIVEVVVEAKKTVTAFLPEANAFEISAEEGENQVFVYPPNQPKNHIEGKVISVSPNISQLADRASPIPNRMVRGRIFEVEIPEDTPFIPGQTVVVSLKKPGTIPILSWFGF